MESLKRNVAGTLLMILCVAILLALSAIISYIVCMCFGLRWTWLAAVGTAVVWIALLLTIYIAMGITDEEEGD